MRAVHIDGAAEHRDDLLLRQMFEWYETEEIPEERLQRILAPVLQMIREGRFSRRCRRRRARRAVAGAAASAAVLLLALRVAAPGVTLEIPEGMVPLAEAPAAAGSLAGRVTLEGEGVGGVVLTLADVNGGVALAAITGSGGEYRFDAIPDGDYRLVIEPPERTEFENGADGLLLTVRGKQPLDDIDIRLYRRP